MIQRALIVKPPWARMIVQGKKTMEVRGQRTQIRDRIGIIEAGTGTIIGEVDLYGAVEIISRSDWERKRPRHCVPGERPYRKTYGWSLSNPLEYKEPVKYQHPKGAQRWVKIN